MFKTFVRNMSRVNINFKLKGRQLDDPATIPCLIIGLGRNINKLGFEDVKHKLKDKVSEETWNAMKNGVSSTSTDTTYLYMNRVIVARLPTKCSRHNTTSRSHAVTKLIKSNCFSSSSFSQGENKTEKTENLLIVCDYADVYASGCAVARAFSLYSRKTSSKSLHALDSSEIAPESTSEKHLNVEFICPDRKEGITKEDVILLDNSKSGIQLAARIVDAPCNEMHTDAFLDEVREVGKKFGIVPTIIRDQELEARGFGGIYGVGKGALHPPALAVLSHCPQGATMNIAWVGKGIVYDTGGLSIKGKTAMPGMKRDCGGAAGILGAFYAAVSQGFEQNLHAIFCLAENSVSDRATRPDDIHILYSGRSVEINNTDAEGRLVVSDGVVYAKKDLKADIIVDMCTLTGAQGISTGRSHAAHLTNSEEWEGKASVAGRKSGDLTFPLVYCPEFHYPEFTSAVADMKNSVADRSNAQSSCAGLFINAHLGFDYPGIWLHVDMAAPSHVGERASGYGVALLNALFSEHISSNMLKYMSTHTSSDKNGPNSEAFVSTTSQGNAPKKQRIN